MKSPVDQGYTLNANHKIQVFNDDTDIAYQLTRVYAFIKDHPSDWISSIATTSRYDEQYKEIVYTTEVIYLEGGI